MFEPIKWIAGICLVCTGVAVLATACSDSNDKTGATATAVTGGSGLHCKETVEVSQAECHADQDAGHAHDEDGGAKEADGGATSEYGETMFNSEGDDDDCKYHLKWSAASGSGGVNFTVSVSTKKDNTPVTGAPVEIEAFLDETHPAQNTNPSTKETSPGTYTVGPIGFDKAGQSTVRFHVHDDCNDSEQSPHGHAAFFVQLDLK